MDRRSVLLGITGTASLTAAEAPAQPQARRRRRQCAALRASGGPTSWSSAWTSGRPTCRCRTRCQAPAMRRLEAQGVSFDRQYCTAPMCTPSRATMWTGVHAKHTGLWDNTNFAWIGELSRDIPTIGHLLREQGYYTAFKGKWHLSAVPHSEDGLEPYGFADYQQWGDMFGATLQGAMLDDTAAFEAIDWLEHKAPRLDQPWLLVCSLVNPHDIMYLRTDPVQAPHPEGLVAGLQSTVQRLGWFERWWDVALPANFADDYARQPFGVRSYKENVDLNYGRIPDDRTDLWLKHRNYLINCMRLADAQFMRILAALDRLDLWQDTVVILMEDHGEMNGAHRMTQKGGIPFDEAAIVNLTVCAPGGPQGRRTAAVGSHLDLAPTLLAFAGLDEPAIQQRYPHLKGRSLMAAIFDPDQDGPRGSANAPGDGALVCWDGLNSLDNQWSVSGALRALTGPGTENPGTPDEMQTKLREAKQRLQRGRAEIRRARLQQAHLLPRRRGRATTSWCAGSARRSTAIRPPWTSCMRIPTWPCTTWWPIPASWRTWRTRTTPVTTRRWSNACSASCTPWCSARSARTGARSISTCSARAR